jgi:hypothetical protein
MARLVQRQAAADVLAHPPPTLALTLPAVGYFSC